MSQLTEEEAIAIREFSEKEVAECNKYFQGSGIIERMRVGPKGYVLYKGIKDLISDIYNMPLRPDDIFVTSYMRSGTTWTQELVWLVANDSDFEKAKLPLTNRYCFLEGSMLFRCSETNNTLLQKSKNPLKTRSFIALQSIKGTQTLAKIPLGNRRFIKSHLPISLLPPKLIVTAKVVYVARDPRDVIVSYFHYNKLQTLISLKTEFKQFWTAFRKDFAVLNPYFEHVKEAWSMRDHPNMLFLFYEELSKDLEGSIQLVAKFLGKEVKHTHMRSLCEHLNFENFKQNKYVNREDWKDPGLFDPKESFIRKGKVGGWRDYFDEEMTKEAAQWIEDNLRDTDLRYPSMEK